MGFIVRRSIIFFVTATFLLVVFRLFNNTSLIPQPTDTSSASIKDPIDWKNVPPRYPVTSMIPLPSGTPSPIPRIQHDFGVETEHAKQRREERAAAVKSAFLHSWEGYKEHAWLQDEVAPISGLYKNDFNGRGATLIDTLDTLLIMGLDEEFELALAAVKNIDFSTSLTRQLNLFETTIRYLGGLLAAYDLSERDHDVLLDKAVQLGDFLYAAFDTPNHLPITRWDWEKSALSKEQAPQKQAISAEIGSLSLEFTRLSQLTDDPKYYDAVQRITNRFEEHQGSTGVPGLFPLVINMDDESFGSGHTFTFGGMSDSLYEYFPKQHMLLGGVVDQYKHLYENAILAAKHYLFFRPMIPQNQSILISGSVVTDADGEMIRYPEGQHLACFTGGMVGIGAKIFNRTDELDIARKLVDGCIWAYDSMPTGIMPETFHLVPCPDADDCEWSESRWHDAIGSGSQKIIEDNGLVPGYTRISDKRFLLRPEAIESIFILYRITGDVELQDAAWRMFNAINKATRTEFANAAIEDVTCPLAEDIKKIDSCESFWMGETLKYFYLIFSEPSLVSLDDFVFNTEAHPLRRPQQE